MTLRASFWLGARSSGGYFVSTFLFGLMFGLAATAAGLELWQSLLMSGAVFSASAQFAALEFWQSPLPLGTIALSVFLVSTRNILLGMSMTHHFDGHSVGRRTLWLFLLNDPGVVTSFRLDRSVDRLGYVTGYGLTLMTSWMLSTWAGVMLSESFQAMDLGSLRFAGPLVLATMMVLFAKGSDAHPLPWLVSGIAAVLLYHLSVPPWGVLPLAVLAGLVAAIVRGPLKQGAAQGDSHD